MDPGYYEFEYRYVAGKNALSIEWLALLVDGVEIMRDAHIGGAGHRHDNNTYSFVIHSVAPGTKYSIRTRIKGSNGTDSTGGIIMRKVNPNKGMSNKPNQYESPETIRAIITKKSSLNR